MSWSSIETAPHNRDILVWDDFTRTSVVARLPTQYDDPSEPMGWVAQDGSIVGDPILWRPLISAPNADLER